MNIRRYIVAALVCAGFALCSPGAYCQYYDWGQEPASVKWWQVEADNGKIVFPDYYSRQALRLMNYMDTLLGQVGYGFRKPPMKMPLVLHTQNFSQNGIVILAPSRMEFIVAPPSSTFAMPWHKQLAVHEFRHAVQYGNTNRNFVKVLSWVLGQQGSLVGIGQLPNWMVEGDAVLTETEFATFGRGVQPSFTIDYRAIAAEGRNYRRDKFFSGSYKDHLPDHYTVGYHIVRFAYDKYGENIWDKVSWFNSRNPYMIFPTPRALRKFYGTSSTELFDQTWERLTAHWASLPEQEDSPYIIPTPTTSFTTYETPVTARDGRIYALKTDLDRTTRLVAVEPETGTETVLAHTGQVNTGLVAIGGRLWWTEYRQSTFWEQRINSRLCYYDIPTGKTGTGPDSRNSRTPGKTVTDRSLPNSLLPAGNAVTGPSKRHALFPAEARDGSAPAYVEYHLEGYYSVHTPSEEYILPDTISIHGLTYDRTADAFFIIGLSDAGMWIGRVNEISLEGEIEREPEIGKTTGHRRPVSLQELKTTGVTLIHGPSYSSLSGLRAEGGRLYYTSIASGRDEAHMFDLAEGREYRLTASRYGSFSPSPMSESGDIAVTTYTSRGYMLAVQDAGSLPPEPVALSRVPENLFNPPSIGWDVMNIDTVTLGSDSRGREVTRYRKAARQFRFHSWAPFWFEPDRVLEEDRLNVYVGATVMSQNLLNSAFSTFGYKYTDSGSLFTAGLKFYGWAPKFEIDAEYGTMGQSVILLSNDFKAPRLDNHYVLTGRTYLPILLGSGYHIRWLTPVFEVEQQNIKYYKFRDNGSSYTDDGVQKFRFSLSYTDNVRMAHKDFLPRFGYALRISQTFTPLNEYFGGITSAYGRIYLPGILPHNSLMVRAAAQKQTTSLYNFRQKDIFPRGADYSYSPDRYGAFTVDYQIPLCYPDGGINSVLYIRRIRANVFYDFARFRQVGGTWDIANKKVIIDQRHWKNINSYGLDITFDIVPFRLPSSTDTAVTLSIYKPSDHKRPVFSAGLVLPL
ncbi:MAG: hypothetical protein LIO85_04825 [Rikenellaceae bacterium]|nr:hypothetical protein [Rikenellaceae bacterium]